MLRRALWIQSEPRIRLIIRMSELLYKDEAYRIVGACMEVHKELGSGFLEAIYQEALEREFIEQKIPYARKKIFAFAIKGNFSLNNTSRIFYVLIKS